MDCQEKQQALMLLEVFKGDFNQKSLKRNCIGFAHGFTLFKAAMSLLVMLFSLPFSDNKKPNLSESTDILEYSEHAQCNILRVTWFDARQTINTVLK